MKEDQPSVWITGANGLIGHHLALAAAKFAWHVQTTIANLEMLQQAREGSGTQVPQLVEIIGYLKQRAVELGEAKP